MLTIDRHAHLVGGCRMGFEPEWSVVDSDHRVWGMPNLFVCDGSVMPSGGRGGADDHGVRSATRRAAGGLASLRSFELIRPLAVRGQRD